MNKNLVELKDLMIHPFCICLTKEYRNFLISKGLKSKGNLKVIAKEIGCHVDTLKNFKKYDKVSTSAKYLMKLLNLLDVPISEAEMHVYSIKRGCSNREVKINLPIKATPKLSLLIAKTCGDGSVLSDWRFHYTNNQLNLIEEVIDAVNSSIGQTRHTLHRRESRRVYEIKFSPVVGYILHFLGSPKGYKLNQESFIPSWIINGSLEIKSAFLRGLFDDESTVDFRGGTKRIVISMGKKQIYEENLKHFLNQIRTLLFELNVEPSNLRIQCRYRDNVMITFAIYQKENFKNFKKYIRFTHSKKKNNLRDMINSYVNINQTRINVLQTIYSTTKPLTTKEIATINQIKPATAKPHLINLLNEGLINRTKKYRNKWFQI